MRKKPGPARLGPAWNQAARPVLAGVRVDIVPPNCAPGPPLSPAPPRPKAAQPWKAGLKRKPRIAHRMQ